MLLLPGSLHLPAAFDENFAGFSAPEREFGKFPATCMPRQSNYPVMRLRRLLHPAFNSLHPTNSGKMRRSQMSQTKEKGTRNIVSNATAATKLDSRSVTIDRTAPAGSVNSLGAESVRDGRPATDDSTVEAIDEVGPSITAPLAKN
jgi:hypothetical protein